jgi:3-oxoadipate enol-lactonase
MAWRSASYAGGMATARLDHEVTGPDDAPVVVLAGALGTTHAMWTAQVDALADRYRVLAIDQRTHGHDLPGPYTIADLGGDVLALLDELGVDQASYVGISVGGMVGLWLAQNAPDRWHRVALMCAAAQPVGGAQMWTDRAAAVRADGTAAIADATMDRWFTPEYAETHAEQVAAIRKQLVAASSEGYAGCCEAIRDMDLREGLAGITAPTLLIAADGDQSIPAEHVLRVAETIPGARFEVIENAAHLIAVSHADQVNALLLEHLG